MLVQVNQYSRKISFTQAEGEESSELCLLQQKVREEFKEITNPEDKLTFQMRDKDFGGLFVDYFEDKVPDRAVFKVVIERHQVRIKAHHYNSKVIFCTLC